MSLTSPELAGRFFTTSATWVAHLFVCVCALQADSLPLSYQGSPLFIWSSPVGTPEHWVKWNFFHFMGFCDVWWKTLATSCKELTHWKRLWCLEGLEAGGEGDDRGWDGWMASLTLWTWVWVNSGSWWWTGRPGVLRFMGLQRAGHDWATELNWNYGEGMKITETSFRRSHACTPALSAPKPAAGHHNPHLCRDS